MQRRAYTLLELAIVTMIVGLGIAFTIPLLLQARTESRQAGCAMKMSRIAQGVLAYEDIRGRLPVAGMVDARPPTINGSFDQHSGQQLSWLVLILPQLDLQDVFDNFDLGQSVFDQPHGAADQSISKFVCPTDTLGLKGYRIGWANQVRLGLGNYAAYISPGHGEHEEFHPGALGGFTPGTTDGQRLVQITDGLSNTIMLSEVRRRPPHMRVATLSANTPQVLTLDPRGAWAVPWVGSSTLAVDLHSINGGLDQPWVGDPNQPANNTFTPNRQVSDQIPGCPRPLQAHGEMMPCGRYSGFGRGFTSAAPRGLHDQGVNAAYVDGRVEFVLDTVDPLAFAQQVSVNDGFPVTRNRRKTRFGSASRSRRLSE